MASFFKALARADLARSGIVAPDAAYAGIAAIPDASRLSANYAPIPALVLPYLDPWSGDPIRYVDREGRSQPFARIRYLENPSARSNPFRARKPQRYAQPPGSGVHAYFPRVKNLDWPAVLQDATLPLVITEGEKKALVTCLQGFSAVGLGGVFNFYRQGVLLPELSRIEWKGRPVYICYDSDAAQNPQIQAAEARLATELSLHRGAVLHLVRLPSGGSEGKIGLDDYLLMHGPDALDELLQKSQRLRKIDAAVVSLNEHVAWIEKEGMVYDLRSKEFIRKGDFTNGSAYSALEILTPTMKGTGVKRVSVAEEWLKHPHAQRYDTVEFRPEDSSLAIQTELGGWALNLWTGFPAPRAGNVDPFQELSAFLFADLGSDADLPVKLLAYKAQHPGAKIPLGLVLVGMQGCGKSLWSECVQDAFSPYSAEVACSALTSQFNGWTERTLIAVVNEAREDVLFKAAPTLRALISDKRTMLNEKFRAARQIDSYTQYIITSNDRGAAAFSGDDRRMIVVSCPPKREESFYRNVANWKNTGGGRALLHYLLSMDLRGWEPPLAAPLTAEKYMAYVESLSPIQRLAEEMRTADQHVIVMWIQQALAWAHVAITSPSPSQVRTAQEIIDSLNQIQIRPWYSPEELALMFPSIVSQLGIQQRSGVGNTASGAISKELRTAGISYLRNRDDPRGFRYRGQLRQFLVVTEPEEWAQPLSQNEFDRLMAQFPKYAEVARMRSVARQA